MRTIAQCMDEFLRGNIVQGMDIMSQRFKALVATAADGHSDAAKYLELIPSDLCAAAAPEELELARRAYSGDIKVREMVRKAEAEAIIK